MIRLRLLWLLGLSASLSASAAAVVPPSVARVRDSLDLTGTVRLDYFRSSKQLDDETDFLGLTGQFKALPTLTPNLDGKVEARFLSPPLDKNGNSDARLLEGYLTWHSSKVEVRVGRQIVAWGRADGINPTDNLTPRDYVVMLPFEDDQRFGTTAAKIDVFVSHAHTLTFFVSPYFEPHRIPFPVSAGRLERSLPARTFANTELGVRLNRVGETLDWSISYFRGFSLLPSLRLSERAGSPVIRASYDRIRAYGADFARNLGRFGIRGEVAYADTADRQGREPNKLNPSLFFILGVDRTFFENLNLNLQYFRRQTRGFRSVDPISDLAERTIAFQSAMLAGQRDHVSDGLTFRVSNKWFHDTLEAEIFGVINFTTHDSFARPQVSYVFSDQWELIVGFDWIRGRADSQFGSQKSNRGVFAETRLSF